MLGPRLRFLWGTALLLLFLPQASLLAKTVQLLVYGALASAAGKRIRWAYFVLFIGSIAFFHLLTPWGRVLATVGPLRITEGALLSGLAKGVTMTGLVFISLFSVSRELELPGRLGAFLARSFFYFERLYSQRPRLRRESFWEDIDGILEDAFSRPAAECETRAASAGDRATVAGLAIVGATIALALAANFAPMRLP